MYNKVKEIANQFKINDNGYIGPYPPDPYDDEKQQLDILIEVSGLELVRGKFDFITNTYEVWTIPISVRDYLFYFFNADLCDFDDEEKNEIIWQLNPINSFSSTVNTLEEALNEIERAITMTIDFVKEQAIVEDCEYIIDYIDTNGYDFVNAVRKAIE